MRSIENVLVTTYYREAPLIPGEDIFVSRGDDARSETNVPSKFICP